MNFLKTKEFKILWPFYLEKFLFGLFSIMTAFFVVYFQNLGISFFDIAKFSSVAAVSVIIFEIPTGVIADLYGRKISTLIGITLIGVSNILIPFLTSVNMIMGVFALAGLGIAFMSGADVAWIVDYLKFNREKKLVQNYMIKSSSFVSAGAIAGPFLGGILATFFKLEILWFIQGFGVLLVALMLLIFGKERFTKKNSSFTNTLKKSFKNTKSSIKINFTNRDLFLLLLASISFVFVIETYLTWQPFLTNLGMPVHYLGYFFSAIAFVGVFAPYLANPVTKIIKNKKYIFMLGSFLSMVFLLLLYFIEKPYFYFGALFLILSIIWMDIISPIESTVIQNIIPSNIRAAVTSVNSMIIALFGAISVLVIGNMIDKIGPKMTIIYFSFFAIPSIIFYAFLKKESKKVYK